jgi:hypothetical protein
MRSAYLVTALASTAVAAPAPSLFDNIIIAEADTVSEVNNIISTVVMGTTCQIAAAVSSLVATLQTNAESHRSIWNFQNIV